MNSKSMLLQIKKIQEHTKKIASTKGKAQVFLSKTGVYTTKGNLTKPYK